MTMSPDLERGMRNLLDACAGARGGERLLIVEEEPELGYYGGGLGRTIASYAAGRGLDVERHIEPFSPAAAAMPAALGEALRRFDHVLFLARLGDQLRFSAMPSDASPIVSYALDEDMLGSSFGGACYRTFTALKHALDRLIAGAEHIRITCPLGTDYAGRAPRATAPGQASGDVTIKRFPISVFSPVDSAGFSGRIAVMHCLAGTGSKYYEPYGIRLDEPVFAIVESNRVVDWQGDADTVERVRAHYAAVAGHFGIERDFVHSWHAGIHPGCAFAGEAFDSLERWSGSAFGNPRLLHFHTCGAYAPGEICWNVVDATVTVDGVPIWEDGRLYPERFAEGRDILARSADVTALFSNPRREIGL